MVLGAPLEESELAQLRRKWPDFTGEVPLEAKYWTESDLDLFFGSNGQLKPRETAKPSRQTCAFLSRCRVKLAEEKVDAASPEYVSWCRLLQKQRVVRTLPGFAECTEVPRAEEVAAGFRQPVVIERKKRPKFRDWNMEFWRWKCGQYVWNCRTRVPRHEQDSDEGAAAMVVEGHVSEYVDYVRIVQRADADCEEESALAYPRFALDNWLPFAISQPKLIEEHWRDISPPGVKDLTPKWIKHFGTVFSMDWMEHLCRFYKVSIGTAGTMGRLRSENHRAHAWFAQAEGKKAFFLFSPQDAAKLYPMTGDRLPETHEGYTATCSPVDIFAPSAKRHPRAAEAKVQIAILNPGDTLVIPAGWWHAWVALEPSVTISHEFWNLENKGLITEAFRECFDAAKMTPDLQQEADKSLQHIGRMIEEDDDSDMED